MILGVLILALGAGGALSASSSAAPHRSSAGAASDRSSAGAASDRSSVAAERNLTQAVRMTPDASNPFASRGMWIWVLADTDGGRLSSIISSAKRLGIHTLFIKSGDGPYAWPQFNRGLVNAIHAAGLDVCAWQYVYGVHPQEEAQVGEAAVADGANCLVVDAESQYQGRYSQAQTYFVYLRRVIGQSFPVALASFPYVDYHPAFPYSVFLGPGGAQYNLPQMYWKAIGTTTDEVYAHTYSDNELYGRPIEPLGQIYGLPSNEQVERFRKLSRFYGAPNVSWWDWQSSGEQQLVALSRPEGNIPGYRSEAVAPVLDEGDEGDLVVWAQEHLAEAGFDVAIDGAFGPDTHTAVLDFQRDHGLVADGEIGPETWAALLRYRPVRVHWTNRDGQGQRGTAEGTRVAERRGGPVTLPAPESARLREKGNELGGEPGEGWPTSAKRG